MKRSKHDATWWLQTKLFNSWNPNEVHQQALSISSKHVFWTKLPICLTQQALTRITIYWMANIICFQNEFKMHKKCMKHAWNTHETCMGITTHQTHICSAHDRSIGLDGKLMTSAQRLNFNHWIILHTYVFKMKPSPWITQLQSQDCRMLVSRETQARYINTHHQLHPRMHSCHNKENRRYM